MLFIQFQSPYFKGFRKLKKFAFESTNGFLIPHMVEPKIAKPLFFSLPPLEKLEKKTIFLDLDETLIHSSSDPPLKDFDFVVRPTIDFETMSFYVLKRPGVDKNSRVFRWEIRGCCVYSRDSYRELDGKYVKDLAQMGRDLWKVVIIDDNPNSYAFQPQYTVQITIYTHFPN
ncbi:CTD small phosphatase-like protein [Bienertia sinuspersici]